VAVVITVTDLFCGAGGSSLGAEGAGMELVMAANHWSTAIDVHQAAFPAARHDCADITQVDPRRYQVTDILLASPECTNHSAARGVSRRRQQASLFEDPDPGAERSRATMWDVVRFAEQIPYAGIVVENVVEATRWVLWPAWLQAMAALGYRHRVVSHNSMHHGVPQSRDRIYVVLWRTGRAPDLELELSAHCRRCATTRTVRQAWKPGRTVGRYRQQWHWACTTCGTRCQPATRPAAEVIDWALPCSRIGDRRRPLAPATRARILAGLARYGFAPIVTSGAGNVHERTPGNRARPVHTHPLPTQTATASHALATAGGFMVQPHQGGADRSRVRGLDQPAWTVTASDDRPALVVPLRRNGHARPTSTALATVTAGGFHHALVMRNNTARGDQGQMTTPSSEPVRTVTAKGHQSLVLPYYGTASAQPAGRPLPTVTTRDRCGLVEAEQLVDDCGFRMLEPHEIAAAMAFPAGYVPDELTKRDRVRLAGNAVTPPVMAWLCGRLAQTLEAAP
jgi:DNA (cytosine-5)-methyltransferase 1